MQGHVLGRGNPALLVFKKGDESLPTLLNLSPKYLAAPILLAILAPLAACQPAVKVEAPEEPITINLNIKLDADVRLRLEEEAREDIEANPDIF